MGQIRVNYANFNRQSGGKGVVVVLMYSGQGDPKIELDKAVDNLVEGGVSYFELVDAHLDNPWTRVLMTDINDMTQEKLDYEKHNLMALRRG